MVFIKKDFLEQLKDITPDGINKIIEANGKPRKKLNPIEFLTDEEVYDYIYNNKLS